MYALLDWAGATPSTSPNGDPLANNTRPSLNRIASSNVHSALDVGLESGKMIGRLLISDISMIASLVNEPACVLTPISAVGRRRLMASIRYTGPGFPPLPPLSSNSCANACLCAWRSRRALVTSPLLSINQQERLASAIGTPHHRARPLAISSPMPVPASPAPKNSTRCRANASTPPPCARNAASNPDRAMLAVP